jgi:hypothetical protein
MMQQFKRALAARPFRPFHLRLADGSRLRVPHPEFAWIHPGGRTCFIAVDDDSAEIVDLPLVTAIELGNGSSRARGKRK